MYKKNSSIGTQILICTTYLCIALIGLRNLAVLIHVHIVCESSMNVSENIISPTLLVGTFWGLLLFFICFFTVSSTVPSVTKTAKFLRTSFIWPDDIKWMYKLHVHVSSHKAVYMYNTKNVSIWPDVMLYTLCHIMTISCTYYMCKCTAKPLYLELWWLILSHSRK